MKLCAVLIASALVIPPAASAYQHDAAIGLTLKSGQMQITQPTEAPGFSLSRGTYSIRVADRLQDRLIVQIQKKGSGAASSLLGYPNPSLRGGSFTGPITFVSGLKGKPTLRGYAFPGGPVVEFVFPKKDAVDLAKNNDVRVMAVDTASEGRVALPNLTQTDMTEVTLWMLTPTPVDPATSKPGIQAARYQAPVTEAQNTPPAPLSAPANTASPSANAGSSQPNYAPAPASHRNSSPARGPVLMASNHPPRLRPNVKQLPHTASGLPLMVLVGALSFCSAVWLSVRRRFYRLK